MNKIFWIIFIGTILPLILGIHVFVNYNNLVFFCAPTGLLYWFIAGFENNTFNDILDNGSVMFCCCLFVFYATSFITAMGWGVSELLEVNNVSAVYCGAMSILLLVSAWITSKKEKNRGRTQ